jgi:hypothetical protein
MKLGNYFIYAMIVMRQLNVSGGPGEQRTGRQ